MDSMEWFLGSVAVLTAVLLVGLDTVRSLQRYRVRLGRLLKNLTLTERIEIDLGAWLAVTVILGMNTWYFNESDVGEGQSRETEQPAVDRVAVIILQSAVKRIEPFV